MGSNHFDKVFLILAALNNIIDDLKGKVILSPNHNSLRVQKIIYCWAFRQKLRHVDDSDKLIYFLLRHKQLAA